MTRHTQFGVGCDYMAGFLDAARQILEEAGGPATRCWRSSNVVATRNSFTSRAKDDWALVRTDNLRCQTR